MYTYPMIEENGCCASISTRREPTRRWRCWVMLERGRDFARLKDHPGQTVRVPNDYPSEEKAVEAAYAMARQLIAQQQQQQQPQPQG